MSGSDRAVEYGVDPYAARTEAERAAEAAERAAAESLIRRYETDPVMLETLLQMVGFAESPPSKHPSWAKAHSPKSRAKPKAAPDAVE